MALFNRRKTDQATLPEIERYYNAEKRERAGMAWFLAIASIAAVALLIIGLFFGGRWVYRKATHSNDKTGVSTTETVNTGISNKTDSTTNQNSSDNPTNKTPAATTPKPTTPAPATPSSPSTPPSTPNTNLANTGPSNTLAVFIITTLGFAGLHNLVSRSRRTS